MKKAILLLLPALLLTGCQPKTYTIKGTVSDENLDGNYIYLCLYQSPAPPLDSTLVEDGAFSFSGKADTAILATLRFKSGVSRVGADFILENGKIQATLDDDPQVTGTPRNDKYITFRHAIKEHRRLSGQREEKLATVTTAADSAAIKDEYATILLEYYREEIAGFVFRNTDNLAGALACLGMIMEFDEEEKIFATASEEFLNASGMAKRKETFETQKKSRIGQPFLDFELPDETGTLRKLSDFTGAGKVVLIDFWASWCGPCIGTFPGLKAVYDKFAPQGFEIFGVSLDSSKENWLESIDEHGLTWPQLSDLKGWNSAAGKLYGVRFIPHTVLIDQNGIIVEKNLPTSMLEDKLEELL